jgi:hypothetical protein
MDWVIIRELYGDYKGLKIICISGDDDVDYMDWNGGYHGLDIGETNHTEHAVYSQSMRCSCKSSHQVREMMIEPWEDWDVRSRYEAMMHL